MKTTDPLDDITVAPLAPADLDDVHAILTDGELSAFLLGDLIGLG